MSDSGLHGVCSRRRSPGSRVHRERDRVRWSQLPGLSGLDFQSELNKAGVGIPIVFLTGYGDIPMSVRAIEAGALEFLTKPFRTQR
jgi:DNA-binding NtrC family response regulator